MEKNNFDDIYKSITSSGVEEQLSLLKKKTNLAFILFFVAIVVILFMFKIRVQFIVTFIGFVFLTGTLMNYIIQSGNYKKSFKELIIGRLVNLYNKDFSFSASCGISDFDYRQGHFEIFDRYHSEDLIRGSINDKYDFQMSEVKTEEEEVIEDSDGNTHIEHNTLFSGVFGIVELQGDMPLQMHIKSNSFINRYNKDRIEVDSLEFEKEYDMFATDKVRAMEIFTSELIEEFNKYQEETKRSIEIKVKNNRLFFRIACGATFEAPMIKDALSYEFLQKNYRIIDYPVTIISKMLENATRS